MHAQMIEASDDATDSGIELSVVIPAYNAAASIGDQLGALIAQRWSGTWEIVVADNGSSDGTVGVVEAFTRSHDRVRLVDASDHSGAAHARNRGVEAAHGRLIAFCDADDVVAVGWLAAIADGLRLSSFVTGPQEYERLNAPWLHGVYGTVPARQLQTFQGIFPFGPTANLGIDRALFEDVGRFDRSISIFEDLELCLRVWLAGVQLRYLPDAVVHYRYRPNLRTLWKQAVSYGAGAPAIARRLAASGRTTPSHWRGAKNWIWLIRRLPTCHSRSGRARWTVVAGGCVGRLVGSARHRYLVL